MQENDTFESDMVRGEVAASRFCRAVVFSITGVSARLGDDGSFMGVLAKGSKECSCVSREVKQDRRCLSCFKRGRILVTTLTFADPSHSPIDDASEGDTCEAMSRDEVIMLFIVEGQSEDLSKFDQPARVGVGTLTLSRRKK